MSQLKKDYISLKEAWFGKPSVIDEKDAFGISKTTGKTLTRYKHLLLSKLFLKNVWDDEKWKTLATWRNNWKKAFFKNHNINGISKEIISYPLEEIYLYIENNLNSLKWENIKQIDVARIFWIKSLVTFYRIIKVLWFLEEIKWKLVKLPVDKFEELNNKLKAFLIENSNQIKWEDILNIWKEININNPEILHSAISALWIAKQYWINKLKIRSIDKVEEIISYIKKTYDNTHTFSRIDIMNILENFEGILWENEKENITKITSLLKFYLYDIEDIREYRN